MPIAYLLMCFVYAKMGSLQTMVDCNMHLEDRNQMIKYKYDILPFFESMFLIYFITNLINKMPRKTIPRYILK